MSSYPSDCLLCRGKAGDEALKRVQIWENDHPLPEAEHRAVARRVRQRLAGAGK